MIYIVSYDLLTPGQNYLRLTDAIKAFGTWAKINQSCWAVKSNLTAVQICTLLSQYVDANDSLFVCSLQSWASRGISDEVVSWLNN